MAPSGAIFLLDVADIHRCLTKFVYSAPDFGIVFSEFFS